MSVDVNASNPSTINVSWVPPPCLQRNGLLSGYIVRYSDTTRPTEETTGRLMRVNNRSTLFVTLNPTVPLEPFRNYSIEVAAVVNGTLDGVYSPPLYASLIGSELDNRKWRRSYSLSLSLSLSPCSTNCSY